MADQKVEKSIISYWKIKNSCRLQSVFKDSVEFDVK